jgi:hypothetical protein
LFNSPLFALSFSDGGAGIGSFNNRMAEQVSEVFIISPTFWSFSSAGGFK